MKNDLIKNLLLSPQDKKKLKPAILNQIKEHLNSIKFLRKFLEDPEIIYPMVISFLRENKTDKHIYNNIENIGNYKLKASSRFRGVYLDKKTNKYYVKLRRKSIGTFEDEITAALAYDNSILYSKYYTGKHCLNFPEKEKINLISSEKEKTCEDICKYRGVTRTNFNTYRIFVSYKNQHISVGTVKDPIYAAELHDIVVIKINGDDALLNFPKEKYKKEKNIKKLRGVYYHKEKKKWISEIRYKGYRYRLGSFINPIDAAKAYDRKSLSLKGPASLDSINFPWINY